MVTDMGVNCLPLFSGDGRALSEVGLCRAEGRNLAFRASESAARVGAPLGRREPAARDHAAGRVCTPEA